MSFGRRLLRRIEIWRQLIVTNSLCGGSKDGSLSGPGGVGGGTCRGGGPAEEAGGDCGGDFGGACGRGGEGGRGGGCAGCGRGARGGGGCGEAWRGGGFGVGGVRRSERGGRV